MSWGVCVCTQCCSNTHVYRPYQIYRHIRIHKYHQNTEQKSWIYFFPFLTLGYKLTLGRIGRNNLTTFFILKKVYQDWFTKHSSKSIQKTMSICPFPRNDFTKMASSVQHFNHRPLKYQGTFKHQVVSAIFLVSFFCSNKNNIFSYFLLFKYKQYF